jgi:hypothetical protein
MLVPNFIRAHYDELNQCYITLLEIGGSHAHRLKPLIDHLGLLTLIITDLDTLDKTGGVSVQPAKGAGQKTNNVTLKTWVPKLDDVDELMRADGTTKTLHEDEDPLFAVRAAYQIPLCLTFPGIVEPEVAYPYTFEDALAFENLRIFAKMDGTGLVGKFRDAIANGGGAIAIGERMYRALKNGKKAEFALDVMEVENFDAIAVPRYIAEGLEWLLAQLKKKQVEVLPLIKEAPPEAMVGANPPTEEYVVIGTEEAKA